MAHVFHFRSGKASLLLAGWLVFLAGAGPPVPAGAEQPLVCQPPTISGFAPTLTPVTQQPPRPATGPESVSAFVEGLSSNDAAFEVVVGQGRILTTREAIAAPGKSPAIVVGDPSVVELYVVSARQIRVIGLRIGVTDLSM